LSGQIKEPEFGRACGTCEVEEKLYMVLVGKTEGQKPLGRPRRRWEDNIKVDRKDGGSGH
jgi:hypothetical protein